MSVAIDPAAVALAQAGAARAAAPALAAAGTARRNAALHAIADALLAAQDEILAANALDLADAEHGGLPGPLRKRLEVTPAKLAMAAAGVRQVAALPDPLGEVIEAFTRPNGLRIEKVRVPIGVIGIIYESRPLVTVDAAVLCLKAGNAVLLKGGSETARSNAAVAAAVSRGLVDAGLPGEAVQCILGGREAARALMGAVGLVDLLIPRGGAGLIQTVVREARVPAIETGVGNCHVYVHAAADLSKAVAIAVNAKCSNPAVCNAAETLLIDAAVADRFLPVIGQALHEAGVSLRGDAAACALLPFAEPAGADDWATEYLDLIMAVRVVDGLDAALAHIRRWGTVHSEAIITEDAAAATRFLAEVDAAAVIHNASTRFTDGGEFGFGAEIGISTQKLHARGPMGLREICSYKYVVRGDGQVR